MSYVLATPEMVAAAANNLAQIGSTLSAANAAALAPTTGVLAAGADEVSAAVASLFSGHAQAYQTLGTQAAAFHERFIQALSTAAGAYGSAEAANASPLQQALNVINAPTQTLLGRRPVGTITDQRTSQQCLGGRIDRVQQTLLNVGGLGVGIRPRTRTQGLHELGMKRRRLRADRLIRLGVRAEERRNRRRYVICARGQHAGGRDAGSRVSRADRRTEIGQIRGRRRQELRNGNHKRHWPPPNSFRTNRRQQSLLSQRIGGRGFRLIRPMDLDRYRAAGSGPPALCAPALARSGSAGGLRVPVKVNTASSPGPSPSQLSTSTVTT